MLESVINYQIHVLSASVWNGYNSASPAIFKNGYSDRYRAVPSAVLGPQRAADNPGRQPVPEGDPAPLDWQGHHAQALLSE
ncbi:hypothetical protein NPIL_251601 [Nephila pilipes]|uniref:Uncharacterized protein n=1 Tax=Nephila pilipes TaxID=299642 RepID=A0A8X6TIC6_NEPPI|nr:hypothetical protein NPIL_251601 [Nephila pilipes]